MDWNQVQKIVVRTGGSIAVILYPDIADITDVDIDAEGAAFCACLERGKKEWERLCYHFKSFLNQETNDLEHLDVCVVKKGEFTIYSLLDFITRFNLDIRVPHPTFANKGTSTQSAKTAENSTQTDEPRSRQSERRHETQVINQNTYNINVELSQINLTGPEGSQQKFRRSSSSPIEREDSSSEPSTTLKATSRSVPISQNLIGPGMKPQPLVETVKNKNSIISTSGVDSLVDGIEALNTSAPSTSQPSVRPKRGFGSHNHDYNNFTLKPEDKKTPGVLRNYVERTFSNKPIKQNYTKPDSLNQ